MNINMIHWGALDRLVYAPILFLFIACVVYYAFLKNRIVLSLVHSKHLGIIVKNFSRIKNYVKAGLLAFGAFFLFCVFLEPQWNKREKVVNQEGRDLFIALDVSRSMLAQDCTPSRLECAKKKIRSLVKQLSCERVGLILFSGSTFIQCPLTQDYAAFFLFLDQIDVETISSGTTAIDQAIKKALGAFAAVPDRKNRLLVLFTDGEDFSSNLAGVKREAAEVGMHIFAVGVGTADGAPIPLFNDAGVQAGHQLNKNGGVVISRLNEEILHALATESGGAYIKMSDDNTDVASIVSLVSQYEKEMLNDAKVSIFEQQYPYCAALSFFCFLCEWVL